MVECDPHAYLDAPKDASKDKTGLGIYPDGMVEHDAHVGELLNKLDELGIADNTIVMYSTDNGAETFTWPDGGTTPFHGEKGTNWEGGYRVPTLIRWPGMIKAGTITTTSSRMKTCCRRSSMRPVSPTSRRGYSRAMRPEAEPTRCTSTATTSAILQGRDKGGSASGISLLE